jgi:ubiquinone/menaquinone biosynthesis C-methylase UbiE
MPIFDKLKPKIRHELVDEGIVRAGIFDAVTTGVTEFYEVAPFPNYESMQNKADLQSSVFGNSVILDLKNTIGHNKSFIEVGSGTSQLSLALASCSKNEIVAMDPTLASLKLGAEFAKANDITNINFLNSDIFSDPFIESSFDIVWCSGVLHHTKSTFEGLKIISKWVKPRGYLYVGLYNKYGRLRTNVRQAIYKALGSGQLSRKFVAKMDPHLRKVNSESKKEAWIRDQYVHPLERSHSIDEVLKWFEEIGFEFDGSIPSCRFGEFQSDFTTASKNIESLSSRIAAQIDMNFNRMGDEGGLFLVRGKKKH